MDWKTLPSVQELAELAYLMWQRGWDEANGGNMSYILTSKEAKDLAYVPGTGRRVELSGIPEKVFGKYILVTATGSYFRELKDKLDELVGVCYIPKDGCHYEIVCGLENNRPTSEFDTHLAAHAVRLEADPDHRVVMHNHATGVLTMTHVAPIDEKDFTLKLWRIITEAMVLFPDGIGYVPWCVCGGKEIAQKTLAKMVDRRIVVWGYHGVFTTGKSLHDAFGLLETVDKCCRVWLDAQAAAQGAGTTLNPGISDQELWKICDAFHLEPRAGYLEPR